MPQMFPINWMILYVYFTFFFMAFIINNFYLTNSPNQKPLKFDFKTNKLIWKW